MGFNNGGLAAFVANVQASQLRRARHPGLLLGLNIGKNAATPIERATDDYLTCLDGVYGHADYVTVNISSPNTKNLRDLQSDAALNALLSAIAQRREALAQHHAIFDDAGNKLPKRTPIFLKIAPDLEPDQISAIAATLLRHGIDGVIATNTTLSRDAVRGLPHGDEAGGLSGAPVRVASNSVIRQLRAALGPHYPIIGVGGIMSAQDALDKRQAGADLVQIYTGLIYQGPALVKQVALTLARGR